MKHVLLETLSGKIILSLILLLLDTSVFSAIVVPTKVISNDTIWSADTIKITSDVLVHEKASLTIRRGVVVEFLGAYSILVYGAIQAQGASGDSIQFIVKSGDEDTGWQGIRLLSSKMASSFSYTVFKHGQAEQGGAIYAQSNVSLTIDNSSFLYNKANEGGALFIENTPVSITGCRIFDNTSVAEGGGVYLASCSGAVISGSSVYNNRAAGFGGGIYAESSKSVIKHNRIFNNYCQDAGKGLSGGGGLALLFGSESVLNNLIFNNETNLNGGGLFYISGNGQFVNNTISNNKASQGGGICIIDGNTETYNSIIWNNLSTNTSIFKSHNLYINSTKANRFQNCFVNINADYLIDTERTTNFQNNLSSGSLFLQLFEPIGNSAAVFDAAWYLRSESPCIDAGDQTAHFTDIDVDGKPRVVNSMADIGAHEYQLEQEYSGVYNSDVIWYGKIKVTGNITIGHKARLKVFSGTQVTFAGSYAIIINGQLIAKGEAQKQIVFTRDVPKKNQYPDSPAEGWKGIQFNNNDNRLTSLLEFCVVEYCNNVSNASSVFGGALTCNEGVRIDVKNSIVRYCAANNGGAIFAKPRSVVNFVNSLFYGNYALAGGVFNVSYSALSVLNCTLYDNSADEGGGMYCSGASPAIENSIFWKNSAKKGDQIYLSDINCDPSIVYSVMDKDLKGISGPGSGNQYSGLYTNNTDKNPLFTNIGQEQFSIKKQSPALNAGNPRTTPNTVGTIDLLGNSRIQKIVDMGACEYQEITVTRPIPDLSLIANSGTYTIDLAPYFTTSGVSNSIQFKIPEVIDTNTVAIRLIANLLQITPRLNASGIDTLVIRAESEYGAEAADTFLVRVNYLTVALSSPFDNYRFKLNEGQVLKWSSISIPSITLRGYYLKIAQVHGNETPEQALASGNYWYADTVAPSTSSIIEALIGQKFPVYSRMAWQVMAIGSNKNVVGFSSIRSFYGAPLLKMFYAGVNAVDVDTTIVHDPANITGTGNIIDPKNGVIKFSFNNLVIRLQNNAYYLKEGSISLPYNDTVTLTPEYSPNGSASLFVDSLFIDKNGYSVGAKALWNIPIANASQCIAPLARLSYNDFWLSGNMPFSDLSFPLSALPLAKMTINNQSYLTVSRSASFSLSLSGSITMPVVDNLQFTTDSIGFTFAGISTIDYFNGVSSNDKKLGLNELANIQPIQYIADFSNLQSPQNLEANWKGIFVNRFKVAFTNKNVNYPLLLTSSDGVIFNKGSYTRFNITSEGIDINIDTTFRLSIPSKFNGFVGSLKSFRFRRPIDASVADEIRGSIIVPYIDNDFENSCLVSFNGKRAVPEMQPQLTDFTFPSYTESVIDRMEIVSDYQRFEGIIDQAYRTILFSIPDTIDIQSTLVYFIARGNRVTIAASNIVRDLSHCNFTSPVVLRIYAGNGTYSDYVITVLKIVTGIEQAGSEVSVFPNPAQDFIRISGDNMEGSQVLIFDVHGICKASQYIESTETILPISSFARGVYILQIKKKDSVRIYRVIKE